MHEKEDSVLRDENIIVFFCLYKIGILLFGTCAES